jgi:YgiT-type zinc finger domain-containing protein
VAPEKKLMRPLSNKQRCALCGGKCEATTITHEVKRGTHIYLFQNVPAKICGACRELWIDEEVFEQIARLIETGVPVRKVETSVYDFAPAH